MEALQRRQMLRRLFHPQGVVRVCHGVGHAQNPDAAFPVFKGDVQPLCRLCRVHGGKQLPVVRKGHLFLVVFYLH